MSDLREKIMAIVADRLNKPVEDCVEAASFAEDLDADSLDTVEVTMQIEDEFGVSFPEEELANLKTVGDLIKYVEANKS